MFTTIFSIFSGASCFYLGYHYSEIKKRWETPVKVLRQLPNHSFFSETISEYTQILQKKQENKYQIYSKYHKCPLSTHELINRKTIDSELKAKPQQVPIIAQNITSTDSSNNEALQTQQPVEKIEPNQKKNQILFERLYKDYARQLIQKQTCNSVELIYGPIFSKDTPYKVEKEVIKNVYVSNVRVAKDGEWLTDRFYTVVICNRIEGSYVNGFSQRKSHFPTFRFLNYLTSLKKLQEQTGLVFNVQGQQLTRIDYQGIIKQRTFEGPELPKQAEKQPEQQGQ